MSNVSPSIGSNSPVAARGRSEQIRGARLTPPERILAECLRLIGRQLRRSTLVTVPVSLVVAAGLRHHANATMLILWVGLVVGATAILAFVAGFETSLDTSAAIQNRRNEVITVCLLLGSAWGCAPLIVFPGDPAYQLLLAGSLIGILAATSLGTLMLRPAFFALTAPIVVPLVIRLALVGDGLHFAAAGCAAVSAAALLVHALEASSVSTTLVRNRLENELLGRRLAKFKELAEAADAELDRMYQESGNQQRRDELTGAFNRRQLMEQVAASWRTASEGFDPFTVVLLEIDEFARIVDLHGQEIGDELVRKVAAMLQGSLRTDDCLARMAGAQFAMVLNNALTDGAMICVERIRRKLASTPIDAGEPILVSSSMGLITWDVGIGPRELVVHADEALQQARAAGKNRIAVWGDDARSNGLLSR